ncbi:aa3-type cytochrome oxidase subunit IV [Corynebacterium heidelbergense]|uniref:Cytochrome c oxidase polypeptide 4 n=1 Tax=Corynebacterium heidelbergense TaxID=2055947 RepID=A0A364VD67_9CORY|nr:cytochrome c oxidase subunit 4 [Corynebacterium heidelbergense]RAV34571.1 cytochrome-c oxidase [Corynebacterium heidelbergense]WCZ36335.1 Cytochrome c oxidase polypeptide 4 [Corynebacterium heidelbergense]
MTSGAKLFYGIATFFGIVTVIYILATIYFKDSGSLVGLEWAGATGLVMAFLLALMLAGYLNLTDSKTDIGPADWEEAEIEDGAGVLGFFSASSIWPFVMTVAIVLMAYGLAFFHIWLVLFGAVILIFGGTMLNLQYGLPPEKH